MAGLVSKGRFVFDSTWQNVLPMLTQLRMGHYPATFLDPTIDKEEVHQKLEETDLRNYRRIKAAKTEDRISISYNEDVEKFINLIMYRGHKDTARKEVYKTFEKIKMIQIEKYHETEKEEDKNRIELNPRQIFLDAVENCKPVLRLTRVARGGGMYEVPIPCQPNHQRFKAMKFLITTAREKKKDERFYDKLAHELIAASKNEGSSVKKKLDLHKRCEANKAYVTYKWI